MYDAVTNALIAGAPALDGLDPTIFAKSLLPHMWRLQRHACRWIKLTPRSRQS